MVLSYKPDFYGMRPKSFMKGIHRRDHSLFTFARWIIAGAKSTFQLSGASFSAIADLF